MTADALLRAACARHPDRVAVRFGAEAWTYARLDAAAGERAAALRARGVAAGDRVGLLLPNAPAWLAWFFGIGRLGAVAVPLNPAYSQAEAAAVVAVADCRLVVRDAAGPGPGATPPAPAPVDPAAPAVIFFSSGSTGRPKGIVHSSANLVAIVASVRETWGFTGDDAVFVAMPLAFVYACVVECLTTLSLGGTIVLQERFDPEAAVDLVARGRITAMMGVPSMYRALLDTVPRAGERGHLRVCATAGETLGPDLARAFAARFGAPLVDFYGLTEAPHLVAPPPGTHPAARPWSCGRPVRGVEAAVVDETGRRVAPGELGELIVRAPWMFLGYFRDPGETARAVHDGWLSTGDLVRQDAEGDVTIVERRKALIKRSGFSVVPAEVEAVIRAVTGVAEVAVVGVPDPRLGERVKAWVAPQAGATVAPAEILAACRARLARYKVPDAIEVIAALPKGPTGKVARRDLRR